MATGSSTTPPGGALVDGVLRAWYDCVAAVSISRPVMGDAEKPELTKQFNEGYKTDLAEPGEAPGSLSSTSCPELAAFVLFSKFFSLFC